MVSRKGKIELVALAIIIVSVIYWAMSHCARDILAIGIGR